MSRGGASVGSRLALRVPRPPDDRGIASAARRWADSASRGGRPCATAGALCDARHHGRADGQRQRQPPGQADQQRAGRRVGGHGDQPRPQRGKAARRVQRVGDPAARPDSLGAAVLVGGANVITEATGRVTDALRTRRAAFPRCGRGWSPWPPTRRPGCRRSACPGGWRWRWPSAPRRRWAHRTGPAPAVAHGSLLPPDAPAAHRRAARRCRGSGGRGTRRPAGGPTLAPARRGLHARVSTPILMILRIWLHAWKSIPEGFTRPISTFRLWELQWCRC